jgi:protease-4
MNERVVVAMLVTLLVASLMVGLVLAFSGGLTEWTAEGEEGVAVVNLFGVIHGPGAGGLFSSGKGVDAVINDLNWAAGQDNVKAVVLRINSPGGTVGASQELHDAVVRFKKSGKRLVVSVADMCASGGYYAACPADVIVANPGSIVGSIGVIWTFRNYGDLLKSKLGVQHIVSPLREMTREERDQFQHQIDVTYGQFLDAVIEGRADKAVGEEERAKAIEVIKKSAQGQVFAGVDAKGAFLVDEIGSYQDAMDIARRLAGLPADAPVIQREAEGLQALLNELSVRTRSPIAEEIQRLEEGGRIEYRYVPGI